MKLFTPFPIGTSSKSPYFLPPTGASSRFIGGLDTSESTGAYTFAGAFVAFFAAFLGGGLGAWPYYGNSDISNFLPPPIGCSSKALLLPPPIGC